MNFPDRNHLLQLRKELWQQPHSRASVMVGAGFSLNATPSPGVHMSFPTWRPLTRAMFEEIYPPSGKEMTEWEDQFNRTNPLRIASEYEAAFERQKLESFLRSHVPDSGHQPGPIHRLLLQLPWRDVFTTNYDTLLERTEVTERPYQPVTTVEDLTSAVPPRVIKLHGTLPSQTPFIVTEEDYRTYPRHFAPFVNTVRQALIENSFALFGFSGDDPNFLEWLGWIRDELDNRHAPIYLIGAPSLDGVQRSLLAKRGVTPIDLEPLFPGMSDSPSPAIQWVLKSLLMGRPPSPLRWPKGNTITQADKDYEPALLPDGLNEPEHASLSGSSQDLDEETAYTIIKRWAFEREHYPGWLVPPEETRSTLWEETGRFMRPLIKYFETRSPEDRIRIFYEINWRMEVAMVPLFEDTRKPFEAALDDLLSSLVGGDTTNTPSVVQYSVPSDVDIREAWLEVAFALLREAREMYDGQRWNMFRERIDEVVPAVSKFADRFHYERALWMIWNLRRQEAKEVLDGWSPSPQAALARMQKAGLLVELDAVHEAEPLVQSALRHIRRSIYSNVGRNIYLLSLEGWCMYLLYRIRWMLGLAIGERGLYDKFADRWQELKRWDCSPWPLLEYFQRVLTDDAPRPKPRKDIAIEFDPGRTTVTRHLGGRGMKPWLPAFAYIRLYEQVGIPVQYAGSELTNACKWIIPYTSFWSPALLIRGGKTTELKTRRVLDRTQVAKMNDDLAKNIHQWAIEALKREEAMMPTWSHRTLLGVIVEVLSRLTVRVDTESLREAFALAVRYHAEHGMYHQKELHEGFEYWFERLFTAASNSQLCDWLPELIRFPFPDDSRQPKKLKHWSDPVSRFPMERLRIDVLQSTNNSEEVEEAVAWLLDRGRSESGDGWKRVIRRLRVVYYGDLMTDEQKRQMGELLWRSVGEDAFPDLAELRFNYGYLPAPTEIDVVETIRSCLLSGTPQTSVSSKQGDGIQVRLLPPDPLIWDLAYVSKPIVHVPYEPRGCVEWSRQETSLLWEKTINWWHADKRALEMRSILGAENIVATVQHAGMFLRQGVLPNMDNATDDEWQEIMLFFEDTRRHGVYLTAALPYVLIHRSTESGRIERAVVDALSCENEDAVSAGAEGVRHWIHLASAGLVSDRPEQAFDLLMRRVVFRRPVGIATCLSQMARLIEEMPGVFRSEQVEMMVSCLVPWSEAIALPMREDGEGGFPEEERPELRVLLGNLVSALSGWLSRESPEQAEPKEISDLRALYQSDALPEVRRSLSRLE